MNETLQKITEGVVSHKAAILLVIQLLSKIRLHENVMPEEIPAKSYKFQCCRKFSRESLYYCKRLIYRETRVSYSGQTVNRISKHVKQTLISSDIASAENQRQMSDIIFRLLNNREMLSPIPSNEIWEQIVNIGNAPPRTAYQLN